jgi:tRNA A37 threonylcarbamoyladenosine dehydratase
VKTTKKIIVRLASPEYDRLSELLFSRYPHFEWASFLRFGWRETPESLVFTLAAVDAPEPGDLDQHVRHIRILEPYTLRTALQAESHPLAVGVAHSHPQECAPHPSTIDDDMDSYYSDYFGGFTNNRPYISLIAARVNDQLVLSGRVFLKGDWQIVDRFIIERTPSLTWVGSRNEESELDHLHERTARFTAAFGEEASERLRRATVAVIGAGGTGSIAIEVLARAGVGTLLIADPDHFTDSNLERVHGSLPGHAAEKVPKVVLARQHVLDINPLCTVHTYRGSLPQPEVVDAILAADVALGCTDQQHSRLALSDISLRYLLPAIDCGVMLEGANGKVNGQIVQLVRFLPLDPCALCREMIIPQRLAQELMSEQERAQRQAAAEAAIARGEDPNPYWTGLPQLNTVGYLTSIAGAMAAAYAIGWITGRFDPPFTRMQMNLVAKYFDVQDFDQTARGFCACRRVRGWADQAQVDALITAPTHWPSVEVLS